MREDNPRSGNIRERCTYPGHASNPGTGTYFCSLCRYVGQRDQRGMGEGEKKPHDSLSGRMHTK
jgi:hypothetical protein